MAVTYGGPDTNEKYYRSHEANGRCKDCSNNHKCTHINYINVDCGIGYIYNNCTWGSS